MAEEHIEETAENKVEETKKKKIIYCPAFNRDTGCAGEECEKVHGCAFCAKKGHSDIDHSQSKCTVAPPKTTKHCDTCNLSITGIQEIIDAHFSGKKHLKNASKISFSCDLCGISSTNEQEKNAHLAGKRHQKELKKNQGGSTSNANVGVKKAPTTKATAPPDANTPASKKRKNPDETNKSTTTPTTQDKPVKAAKVAKPQQYAKTCIICDKKFIQAAEYDKHVEGKTHKKKLHQFVIVESKNFKGETVKTYECETCVATLHTDQEVRDHLVSPQHVSLCWEKIKAMRTGAPAAPAPGTGYQVPLLQTPMSSYGRPQQPYNPASGYSQAPMSNPAIAAYRPPASYAPQPTTQPSYAQPSYAQPSYTQPSQPAYAQPSQPAYAQPSQPAYAQPSQPAYSQPAYSQPASSYSQPAPAYSQPASSQASYARPSPAYSQTPASYSQPATAPAASSQYAATSQYASGSQYAGGSQYDSVSRDPPAREYSSADAYDDYSRVGAPFLPSPSLSSATSRPAPVNYAHY